MARTPNQAAVAVAADGLENTAAIKAAILDLESESEAQGAFDALSGEIYPGIATALIEDSRLPRMAALNRLTEAEGGTGAWMQAIGNWGSSDSDGNAAKLDRDTKGALFGIDGALGDGVVRAGLAGGYSDGNVKVAARSSHADVTSYNALGYVGGAFGQVRLRAGIGYTWSTVDARCAVAFPGFSDTLRTRYDATTIQGFAELGYRMPVATGWIEPFAGVSTIRVRTDGSAETGGAAALTRRDESQTATVSTLGLKAATARTGPVAAGLTLGWQHLLGDRRPGSVLNFSGSAPFTVAGVPLARDAAAAEVSLSWRIAPGTMISARYSGTIGKGSEDNAVKAALSMAF